MSDDVATFLSELGCSQYTENFVDEGYDHVSDLHGITNDELSNMNIKAVHRRKILNAIAGDGGEPPKKPSKKGSSNMNKVIPTQDTNQQQMQMQMQMQQQQQVMQQQQMMQQQQTLIAQQQALLAQKQQEGGLQPPQPGYEDGIARLYQDHAQLLHRAKLNDRFICWMYGWANVCAAAKVKRRAFLHLEDHRIVWNMPMACCMGLHDSCITDRAGMMHYTKSGKHFQRQSLCTPYHCCCCIECCGGVVTQAPHPLCNTLRCCCCCFINWYPGLENPQEFISQAEKAYAVCLQRQQQKTPPKEGVLGPALQSMMT